jgi:hypothetical protein
MQQTKESILKGLELVKNVGEEHLSLFIKLSAFYVNKEASPNVAEALCNYISTSHAVSHLPLSQYQTCLDTYMNGGMLVYGGERVAKVDYSESMGYQCESDSCVGSTLKYMSMILAYNYYGHCNYQIINFNPASTEGFVENAEKVISSVSDQQIRAGDVLKNDGLAPEVQDAGNMMKIYGAQLASIPNHEHSANEYDPFKTEDFKDGSWISKCGADLTQNFELHSIKPAFVFCEGCE